MTDEVTVMVVDDEIGPRQSFRMVLKDRYNVVQASGGAEALQKLEERRGQVDVVLMDIKMPGMDGVTLLKEVKRLYPEIEVALVTAYASVETARNAVRLGAVDYLIKPFNRADLEEIIAAGLARRRGKQRDRIALQRLELANRSLFDEVTRAREDIRDHFANTVKALIGAIDAKDHYTAGHSERVAAVSRLIGMEAGLEDQKLEMLYQAAMVHDIGKIGISETVLRKRGPLLDSEFDEMKKHPLIGAEILAPVDFFREDISAVIMHHERFDGKGYPHGLAGAGISLNARIISIADSVDAMASERSYSRALSPVEICKALEMGAGTQFDPDLVRFALKLKVSYMMFDRLGL